MSWQPAQSLGAGCQGHSFVWYHSAVCSAENPPGKQNPALPAAIGRPVLHAELDTFSQKVSSSCLRNSIPSRAESPIERSNEEKLKLVVPLAYSSYMSADSFTHTMHTKGQSSRWLIKNQIKSEWNVSFLSYFLTPWKSRKSQTLQLSFHSSKGNVSTAIVKKSLLWIMGVFCMLLKARSSEVCLWTVSMIS